MNETEFKHSIFSLSERLYPMVSRMLGNKENVEDAIQEIMIKLWKKRHKIAQHPNINGFVILTARNYCIDLIRKKKLDSSDFYLKLKAVKNQDTLEHIEWKELNEVINKILKTLPKQQREIITMRDLEGYEFTEIAYTMQIKIEYARVLLSRARKQVSIALEKKYYYERK